MKKRDEFNKMLRLCYKGKIDMIIVKSISRFARNTLDVIKITRKLREINVDVFFEEQGIHSIDPASEFYITIYGSIAQSESENISANQTAAVPVGSNKSLQIQSGGHPCQFLWRHGDHQLQRDIDRRRY